MNANKYILSVIFILIICCKCKSPIDKDDPNNFTTEISEDKLGVSSFLKSEGNPDVIIFLGDSTQDSTSLQVYVDYFLILGFDVLFPKNSLQVDSTRARFVKSSIEFLHGKGFKSNKIVVYGKGQACYATCVALQDETIRGLILESVSGNNFDFLLRDIHLVKAKKILIIQGDRDDNWETSIQLYKQIAEMPRKILIMPAITQNDICYDPDFKEIAEFFLTENRFKNIEERSFKPW